MSAARMTMENVRKCLSDAILSELESWPGLHRRAFVLAHYRGLSTEEVGSALGLSGADVRQILVQCERKLRTALRDFREQTEEGVLVTDARPPIEARGDYLF